MDPTTLDITQLGVSGVLTYICWHLLRRLKEERLMNKTLTRLNLKQAGGDKLSDDDLEFLTSVK